MGPGWTIFNPREEFARMGLGSRTKAWRFTDINKDYIVSKHQRKRVQNADLTGGLNVMGSSVLADVPSQDGRTGQDLRRGVGLCREVQEQSENTCFDVFTLGEPCGSRAS